jgi:hypothetical protein
MRPGTSPARERPWDEVLLEEMLARLAKHRAHVTQELGRIDRFLTQHSEHCYTGPGCRVCCLRRGMEPGELTRPQLVVSNKSKPVSNKSKKPVGKTSEPRKPKLHREHFLPEPD